MLEESYCPSIQLCINGFEFILPASWNILVCDRETSQLDVVELSEVAGREFTALTHGPTIRQPTFANIIVTNYFVDHKNVGPSLTKHQMMMHPIGPDVGVLVGPSDVFNKYLKTMDLGDLI
jgi:hypothetical protein